MSHDLRNPLTVVQGQLDLVSDDVPDDRVEMMERNLTRMDEMIDDLLTMSRAGETVEEPETVVLQGVVRAAWEHTDTAGATLEPEMPTDLTVRADGDRLLHLFENLFRNALDHNEAPVRIRVGVFDAVDTAGTHDGFFVEDDGTGIPEDDRDAVFDHGYTTAGSTGLGLSIVQDIVRAHGWAIDVSAGADGGARFEVTGVASLDGEDRADGGSTAGDN